MIGLIIEPSSIPNLNHNLFNILSLSENKKVTIKKSTEILINMNAKDNEDIVKKYKAINAKIVVKLQPNFLFEGILTSFSVANISREFKLTLSRIKNIVPNNRLDKRINYINEALFKGL